MIIPALLRSCSSADHETETSQIQPSKRRSDACHRSSVAARRSSRQGDRARPWHADLRLEERQGRRDQAVASASSRRRPGAGATNKRLVQSSTKAMRSLARVLFALFAIPALAFDLEG